MSEGLLEKLFSARVLLLYGRAGGGKTFTVLNHPRREHGFYLDLEDRYEEMLEFHPLIEPDQYENCQMKDDDYYDDPIATFDKVDEVVTRCIKEKRKLIVLDGIGDLRRQAMEKWRADNPDKTLGGPRYWGQVNDKVRRVLFRLFNYARVVRAEVVTTALLYPETDKDGVLTGKMSHDVKKYIEERTSALAQVNREGREFKLTWGKHPLGPIDWREFDLSDRKGRVP